MIVETTDPKTKRKTYLVTNARRSRVLGTHDTKEAAEKQLAAIEASKARRKKRGRR